MKKLFYFAAAAVALAACAKNEVIPVNSGENQEITFNVAPKTKADPDGHRHQEFGKGNKFASWAYYLGPNKTWKDNSADAQVYISNATIANNTNTGGKWKCEDNTFYWPKDGGSLTFFAYSLNKSTLEFDGAKKSSVGCEPNSGVWAHIDLSVDKNVDFLVADPAKDKKSNVDEGKHFVDGVPTLFRHKLSYVIFNVETDKDYSSAGKMFTLKSIKFKNVSYEGQYRDVASKSPVISAGFTPGAKGVMNYTSGSAGQEIKLTNKGISSIENSLYLPQSFEQGSVAANHAYIEVIYTITTTVAYTTHDGKPSTKEVVEEVTKNIFLYPATGTPMFEKWEMGKKYTINLTFTLDEILWDPAVQDWEDVNIGTDTAPIIVG